VTGGVGETYMPVMIKGETPSAWGFVAANEGQGEPPVVAADSYWEDISLQASARLDRLEEERKQHAPETEIRFVRGRPPRRAPRLVLMVAVGTILFAAVAWFLLKAVPTAALPP
jgi:hypothetical protein